jgi:hypothetical protein
MRGKRIALVLDYVRQCQTERTTDLILTVMDSSLWYGLRSSIYPDLLTTSMVIHVFNFARQRKGAGAYVIMIGEKRPKSANTVTKPIL